MGVEIVSDVSFSVPPNHTLGIVGESGCGKTTVAMALLGFARPGTQIVGGCVAVDGQDLLALSSSELSRARGRVVSYVPQDPSRALSPGMPAGRQIEEILEPRVPATEREALLRAAWEGAQLPYTPEMLGRYPHQLSGGQQQRVAIAMALVCRAERDRDGRADDGPGRAHPEPAARRDCGAPCRSHGVDRVRQPRPWSRAQPRRHGRRDVRGQSRGAGHGRIGVPRSPASVHAAPAGGDSASPTRHPPATRYPGERGGTLGSTARLPIRSALRATGAALRASCPRSNRSPAAPTAS